MNNNQNVDLTKFEVLAETENGMLVGGFSAAFATGPDTNESGDTNVLAGCGTTTNTNCAGGNCVAGCGVKTS